MKGSRSSSGPLSGQTVKTRFGQCSEGTVKSNGCRRPSAQKGTKATSGLCLSIKGQKIEDQADPGEKRAIEAYDGSNFAEDKDKRMSITGYIILICGIPMAWRSKAQQTISKSLNYPFKFRLQPCYF
jgi:hypothetical protein